MNAPPEPNALTRTQRIALFRRLLEDARAVEAALGMSDGALYAALAGHPVRGGTRKAIELYLQVRKDGEG